MSEARHLNAWSEDDGDVLWWTRPVSEPPWVGTPLDSTWSGYHRWWTPLPPVPTVFTPTRRPRA